MIIMNILVSDAIDDKTLKTLKNNVSWNVTYLPGEKGKALDEALKVAEVLIVRSGTKVTKELMDNAPKLKTIIRGGVGIDNIDSKAAKEKGIKVLNTPAATSISVAELLLGFMLCLVRRTTFAVRSMKEGKWEKKSFKGSELNGKTLGILGIGRIGGEVAKRASAFNMKVCAYDPYLDHESIKSRGAIPASLETIIADSNFITLHLPLTDETRHMIDRDAFARMRDGVYILNCARGGVVDERALLDALKSGKVAGAALDVYEDEPTEFLELVNHPNVIATPHIGAATREGQARVGAEIIEILKTL